MHYIIKILNFGNIKILSIWGRGGIGQRRYYIVSFVALIYYKGASRFGSMKINLDFLEKLALF